MGAYDLRYRRKLCQIIRDDNHVRIADVKETFTGLGFDVDVYDLPDGFAATALRGFLAQLANGQKPVANGPANLPANQLTDSNQFGCLVLLFVGGFAVDGRLKVNGADYDFYEMVQPFTHSGYWDNKPKLFFCHLLHNDSVACIPVDAVPVWTEPAARATPGDDVAIVTGGPSLLDCVCQVMRQDGSSQEFKQLVATIEGKMTVELEHGVSVDFWRDCTKLRYPLYLNSQF